MKKALMVLSVALMAVSSFAGEGWFAEMRSKTEKIVPTKKTTVTTAVGGVRGSQGETQDTLYWKGKEEDAAVGEEELEKFNSALDAAINGKTAESLKGFEAFLREYPKSPLAADAKKAIEEIKAGK